MTDLHDWARALPKRTIAGVRIVKVLHVGADRIVCRGCLGGSTAPVGIVVIPDDLDEAASERVHEEMRRAASVRDLHSPHVAAVLDLGHTSDCYYIVSEQRRSTLAQLLQRKPRLSVRRALAIADCVLRGLVALDSIGVVHGNVAPDGILLGQDGSACLARPSATVGTGGDLQSLGATLRIMLGDADALPDTLCDYIARLEDSPPASAQQALDEMHVHAAEWLGPRASLPVRMLTAMRRTVVWSSAAAALLLAAVVPAVLMIGNCRSSTPRPSPPAAAPTLSPWPSVSLTVTPSTAAPLTGDQALAVTALLQTALDWHPAFELDRGAEPALVAPFAMTAVSVPGPGRREWTLTLVRRTDAAQEQAHGTVQRSLTPLDEAVWRLLDRAANPEGARESAPEPLPADATAWAHMARALAAERAGDLPGAAAHAAQACNAAPDADIFAVLRNFWHIADSAERTGSFPAQTPAPATDLPRRLGAFQSLLTCVSGGDEDETEAQFRHYLVTYPRCVRGYYLLGLWRRHAQDRPADADANFGRAIDIDPGYGPVNEQ
jgi:hypothetical protein